MAGVEVITDATRAFVSVDSRGIYVRVGAPEFASQAVLSKTEAIDLIQSLTLAVEAYDNA